MVDIQNRACRLPAREIEAARSGRGSGNAPAARGRRGVNAGVEHGAPLRLRDALSLHVPDQRGRALADDARAC